MFSALFQAIGKGLYSMIMSFARQLVILIPVAYLLSQINLDAMRSAFPIAEVAALIMGFGFFMHLRSHEFKRLDEDVT